MTNEHGDDFEAEARAAFRRHLKTLDPLIPASRRLHPVATRATTSRVTSGGAFRAPGVGLAAVAALVIVAALAGPALLRPGAVASGSAEPSSKLVQTPQSTLQNATTVQPQVVASFGSDDLEAAVLGPDGAGYVIDKTDQTVYRIDLATGARLAVMTGTPRLLAVGGSDVLILDDRNAIWRWRPAPGGAVGAGTLTKLVVPGSVTWGSNVRALGAYITNPLLGQYNLYVVIPGLQQVLRYPEAIDGSGWPTALRSNYLALSRDLSRIDDLYVDGDVYLADGGEVDKFNFGQELKWAITLPPASSLDAQAPYYAHLAYDPYTDMLVAYDRANRRIIEARKSDGSVAQQFVATGTAYLTNVRGMFVVDSRGGSTPKLCWTEGGNLMSAGLYRS